jgi:hypothetical protein
MGIKMATWLHGNGAQPENAPYSQRRMAGSGLFGGTDLSTNWFHFPISTPVIVDDRRPLLTRVFVLYRMRYCAVEAVQLWSGRERIAIFSVTQEPGAIKQYSDVDRGEYVEGKTMFSLIPHYGEPKEIRQGLSISVKVKFDSTEMIESPPGSSNYIDTLRQLGKIEFYSAGADFE